MNIDCVVLQGQNFTYTALTLPAVYHNGSRVRTAAADPAQRLPQRPPNAEDIDPQTSMPVTPQRTPRLGSTPLRDSQVCPSTPPTPLVHVPPASCMCPPLYPTLAP